VQGDQVLHHRQGLLAKAKDIGQPAAASQGQPVINSQEIAFAR